MATNDFKWTIENQIKFQKSLDALGRYTSDFRIPFRLIASDFYRSQRKLFTLKSAGLYHPLGGFNYARREWNGLTRRENAENEKERRTGHAWAPILFGETGNLRDSTLSKNHKNSIFFVGRQELQIGSNVPYGKYHQSDKKPRTKIPQRKFIFIDGGPADRSRDSSINGRRERWKKIIQTHIKQIVTGKI